MHSTKVSKKLLGLGLVVAVRFGQRQLAMFSVEGARSFRRAYDFDRGTKRNCRLYDTVNAQMTGPRPSVHRAHATAPVNASSLSSARIWTLSVARIPRFLFLLTAREDYACAEAEVPAVPELDPTTGSPLHRRRSAHLCSFSSKPRLRRSSKWRQDR